MIYGLICESGGGILVCEVDCLSHRRSRRSLDHQEPGSLLAVVSAPAYGFVHEPSRKAVIGDFARQSFG